MNTTKIIIQGYGEFHVPSERTQEVLNFLASINTIRTQSVQEQHDRQTISNRYPGKELING